jgi:hypothetical protein
MKFIDTPWVDSDSDTRSEEVNIASTSRARSSSNFRQLDLNESMRESSNDDIATLKEKVNRLLHELSITRNAHQLTKDQSNAEIHMLRTEIDLQNSRHEQVVSNLRKRLVESDVARKKMQDQLSTLLAEDVQRTDGLKIRFDELSTRILDTEKWAVEELNQWKAKGRRGERSG